MINELRQHMSGSSNEEIFYWICRHLGVPQRESLGECISCESYRQSVKYDLYYEGQFLFHLECSDSRTNYRMSLKKCGDSSWKTSVQTWCGETLET